MWLIFPLGSAKPGAEITIYQTVMDRPSSTRTTEKLSSTFHPNRDTDSLSIITVRRNPQSAPTRCRHAAERNTKPKKRRSKKNDPCRRWKSEEWQLLRPRGFDARGLQPWVTVTMVSVFIRCLESWVTVAKGHRAHNVSLSTCQIFFAYFVWKRNDGFFNRGMRHRPGDLRLMLFFRLRTPIYESCGLLIALGKWDFAKQNSCMKRIVYWVSSCIKMMKKSFIHEVTPITI